ncbi:MAG: tetratricopeptide repeat protein [Gemmatimonadales bacterium]
MKMRGVFALTMALLVAIGGCASGGGGGGGGGGGTTTAAGPTGSGANLLTQGARPRETDNTDAAEEALEAAQEAAEAQNTAVAQQQYQAAMTAAQAAITEDPSNPLAYRLAGVAALGLEDYEQAAQNLDRAVELRPVYDLEIAPLRENAYIDLYSEAIPLLQSQQYLDAAEVLESANTIFPLRAEAMITLAQIYAQERQHDQAIEKIDQAREFLESPRMEEVDSATAAQWREDGSNLLLMRGQVLADAGRFEEAVATYRELAAEDPSNISVQQDIAAILMTMGREDEAMQEYERLMARPGLSAGDYYRIGVGFYNNEDYERAAQAFERAAQNSPRDRDALEMWARSLTLDSAYTAVAPVAERWIELDPSSQIALSVYAQATNSAGDPQRAAEIMRRAEELFVTVDDLEMRRGGNTAIVNGSVANRTLDPGGRVTLTFTFYNTAGQALGTATHQATLGAVGEKQVFQVEYTAAQPVAGYSYTVARG